MKLKNSLDLGLLLEKYVKTDILNINSIFQHFSNNMHDYAACEDSDELWISFDFSLICNKFTKDLCQKQGLLSSIFNTFPANIRLGGDVLMTSVKKEFLEFRKIHRRAPVPESLF